MTGYAEPVAATNFSFLRGASPGPNLVMTALLLGQAGLGIADRNTVAGVVRAWAALRDLREDGVLAPEKIREGGSPGEYIWVENPAFDDLPFTLPQLQAMAKAFKIATGSRLVFGRKCDDSLTGGDHIAETCVLHDHGASCGEITDRTAAEPAAVRRRIDVFRHTEFAPRALNVSSVVLWSA